MVTNAKRRSSGRRELCTLSSAQPLVIIFISIIVMLLWTGVLDLELPVCCCAGLFAKTVAFSSGVFSHISSYILKINSPRHKIQVFISRFAECVQSWRVIASTGILTVDLLTLHTTAW